MGVWGPAILSDDVACDIRDEYHALLMIGKPVRKQPNIYWKPITRKFRVQRMKRYSGWHWR